MAHLRSDGLKITVVKCELLFLELNGILCTCRDVVWPSVVMRYTIKGTRDMTFAMRMCIALVRCVPSRATVAC